MTEDRRCGSCARFVRVVERILDTGEVQRQGECLMQAWPSPLYESNTCSHYLRRGTAMLATSLTPKRSPRRAPGMGQSPNTKTTLQSATSPDLPEELLDMDMEEFRSVLRDVLRDELGISPVSIGGRWQHGEIVLRPGKEGTAEKRVPIEVFFRKIVAIRDKLRVLEQKLNGHANLSEEDKVQLQHYVTGCYGALTTFNVLFAEKADAFVGQKGDRED